MKTYSLEEKLETMECRRDDKARRVLNVAPDTVAEITADELENGVTLERLDSLNVPALRYSTQLTIHGKLPAFNPNARPGGYKAVFQNSNGSVGVRYSAIDAEKKKTIARALKFSGGEWHASADSTGFSVTRYFLTSSFSTSEELKTATLAAFRALPVSLFYGSAGVWRLPYGMGLAVSLSIGAIPAENLWPLVNHFAPGMTAEKLAAAEKEEEEKREAERAQWEREVAERKAKNEAEASARRARFASFMASLPAAEKLASVPRHSGATFKRFASVAELENKDENGAPLGTFRALEYRIEKRGAKLCFSRNGEKWHAITPGNWEKWEAAAREGLIYGEAPKEEPKKEQAKAGDSIPAPANAEEPASPRQTFALFCATGRDFRGAGLSRGKAHAILSAVQNVRGDKPAARAIAEKMLAGETV